MGAICLYNVMCMVVCGCVGCVWFGMVGVLCQHYVYLCAFVCTFTLVIGLIIERFALDTFCGIVIV